MDISNAIKAGFMIPYRTETSELPSRVLCSTHDPRGGRAAIRLCLSGVYFGA